MNHNKQHIISKVAAVVVCFNPDIPSFILHVDKLSSQFPAVFIVDNSEDLSARFKLNSLFSNYENVVFIQLDKNYGIAKAQNIGIQRCIKLGYEYFCEFDQDSVIEDGFLSKIVDSYISISIESKNQIAGLGPNAIDIDSLSSYKVNSNRMGQFTAEYTLSSGFFVPAKVYLEVGDKSDELFIDLVDWDWCFRANSIGYKVYIDPNIRILHKRGEHQKNIAGFSFGVPAPFRHYYAFRNYIYLVKKLYVPLQWKVKYLFINTAKLFAYPFVMNLGCTRFKYMISGLYDGILGKYGRGLGEKL